MKTLMLILALFAGLNVFASTIDTHNLPILGAQADEQFLMKTVQTRTEYKKETVANTCWRTVLDGYGTSCRFEPETMCFPDRYGRMNCSTRMEQRCYSEARYRQESYTCYETVSVPYEVFNNNVEAAVTVKVSQAPENLQVADNSCGVNFTLDGEKLKTNAECTDFIIVAKKLSSEVKKDTTVFQNHLFDLTLLDAKKIAAPTKNGITEMRLNDQVLSFKTGDLTKNPNVTLKLYIERKRFLAKDITVINRLLTPAEYTFERTTADGGTVKINLEKLVGGINAKKKHVLKVDLNVVLDTANVLNTKLPNLSASESMTVNN